MASDRAVPRKFRKRPVVIESVQYHAATAEPLVKALESLEER